MQKHVHIEGMPLGVDSKPEIVMDRLVFTRNPHVHWTVLDGEAVLLNLDNGVYYTLNRVGTVIWELFTERRSFEAILVSLCERFEVSQEQARTDLETLVTRLHQEGLIAAGKE